MTADIKTKRVAFFRVQWTTTNNVYIGLMSVKTSKGKKCPLCWDTLMSNMARVVKMVSPTKIHVQIFDL